ncbi:MAG: hypothetical protein KDK39_14775 [Leptospiraceae bacterium]|nr:hypothetical protein [Leptospiraceae bacterium]
MRKLDEFNFDFLDYTASPAKIKRFDQIDWHFDGYYELEWTRFIRGLQKATWAVKELRRYQRRYASGFGLTSYATRTRQTLQHADRALILSKTKKRALVGFYDSGQAQLVVVDSRRHRILAAHPLWGQAIECFADIRDFIPCPADLPNPQASSVYYPGLVESRTLALQILTLLEKNKPVFSTEKDALAAALAHLNGIHPDLDRRYLQLLPRVQDLNVWGRVWQFNPAEIQKGGLPTGLIHGQQRQYCQKRFYKYGTLSAIEFKLHTVRLPSGKSGATIGIYIDGHNLQDLFKQHEQPYADREDHPGLAGSGKELGAYEFPDCVANFMGRITGILADYQKLSYLYICECGEKSCASRLCQITFKKRHVIWSKFRYSVRNPPGVRFWDYSAFGTRGRFVFDKWQYLVALESLAFQIAQIMRAPYEARIEELTAALLEQ